VIVRDVILNFSSFDHLFLLSGLYSVRSVVNLLSRYGQKVTFTFIFL